MDETSTEPTATEEIQQEEPVPLEESSPVEAQVWSGTDHGIYRETSLQENTTEGQEIEHQQETTDIAEHVETTETEPAVEQAQTSQETDQAPVTALYEIWI